MEHIHTAPLAAFGLTSACISVRLVASDRWADFVYSARFVLLLLSSAWRAVKGTGIAVAKAAANIDLNLESLEGDANTNKSKCSKSNTR